MFSFTQNLLSAPLTPLDVEPGSLVGWQDSTAITRTQFAQKVTEWHAVLSQISQGKIALYLSDSIEFAAALFAAWHARKTVYLMADTLESNCRSLSQEVSVFIGEFPEHYRTSLPQPGLGATHAEISPTNPAISAAAFFPALEAQFPALVVYTSGSTGEVQAIPKQWSQLTTEIASLESLFGKVVGAARIYSTVSHHHIYGLLFKVLWPFAAGRAIFGSALNFPEQLQQHLSVAPCALIASPAHLKRLPAHLAWDEVQDQLCAVFSSGGPLSTESVSTVQTLLGKSPIEVYGSSETGGIAWRQRRQLQQVAWQAFPQVKWREFAENSAEKNGANSLLEIQSPHLPDAQWFRLADQIQRIDDQHFQLLGRQDRIVKIEEKRISLDRMERALLTSGLVQEVRLVVDALADEDQTKQQNQRQHQRQHIYAFVVPTQQGASLLHSKGKFWLNQELRRLLSQHVESIALPRRWRFLDAFPINAQGKTTQAQLLALLENSPVSTTKKELVRPTKPNWRLLELKLELQSESASVQEAKHVLLEITVPQSLLYFEGHFPVAPILPGVVQVDWAIHFGRQYFPLPTKFLGIQALKFQHVIRAEHAIFLELIHHPQKNTLQFRYFSDTEQYAGGRILFEQAKTSC